MCPAVVDLTFIINLTRQDLSASKDVKRKKRSRKRQKARRGDNKDWKGGMTKEKGRNKRIKGRILKEGRKKKKEVQIYTVELGYNVMKGTEYFVSLQTSIIITQQNNVMVNSEALIGTYHRISDAIDDVWYKLMSL
jgi:hypothetical protein